MGRTRRRPETVRPLRPARPAQEATVEGALSAQAMSLHALGTLMCRSSGRDGLIGREEAERLAARCGAVPDELVEAGLWEEFDVCFRITALAV